MSETVLPNIVVVVMDCVQAREFERALGAGSGVLSELRAESVLFSKAASVAPWTLPSHASLFSGLYPWEHGCHGKGVLRFSSNIARIPQWLKSLGYRTYSISGNPLIGAQYGFLEGFDRAVWGEWWEKAYRVRERPPNTYSGPSPSDHDRSASVRRRVARAVALAAQQSPLALAANDAVLRRMKRLDPKLSGSMSHWIEPTIEQWLGDPNDRVPFFCFVNFIDAHEPYIAQADGGEGNDRWWRRLRVSQGSVALLSGRVRLSRAESEILRGMYRQSLRSLAGRVDRLVKLLKKLDHWDNTLLILTSDHGQAFGDGGMIWHGLWPSEEELRVPLWLRLPRGERPVHEGVGWASPLDVAATILHVTGLSRPGLVRGFPLQELATGHRPQPLLAVSDGVGWNTQLCARLPSARVAELDQVYGVAYARGIKVVSNVSRSSTQAFDIESDPDCLTDLWGQDHAPFELLAENARNAGLALLAPPSLTFTPVDRRVHSWGYG